MTGQSKPPTTTPVPPAAPQPVQPPPRPEPKVPFKKTTEPPRKT
jgi:hypothetical protein